MHLNEEQYRQIARYLPKQRGNVDIENRRLLEALIFRCRTGCAWRTMPGSFGNWHTIYTRLSRWSKNGVLDLVYAALASEGLKEARVFGLDSATVKAHPDAHGARKKRLSAGRAEGGTQKSTSWRPATLSSRASGGNAPAASAGRLLLDTLDPRQTTVGLAMDRAYSDDLTRLTAWALRYTPVVPPKRNRKSP